MGNFTRRDFARFALCASSVTLGLTRPHPAHAEAWPARPVAVVVPYPPGGIADPEARIICDALLAELGQPFVVQNKGGAAGAIATEYVAHAQPDGYTLLFATSAQTTILPLTQQVPYTLSDLAPIGAVAEGPMVLGIASGLPAENLKDFIALIAANPGKYSYGSGGIGSVGHLVSAAFVNKTNLDMVHVPYHGGGPAILDLIAGRMAMYFGNAGELMPHRNDEHIRLIAVSSERRMSQMPDVPAIAELLPGFHMAAWRGLMAPAGTPQPIIDRVNTVIRRVSRDPAVIEKISNLGDEVLTTTPAQHGALIADEQNTYAAAIKDAGLKRE